ncbi:MAG: prolyl oligopeptidase family serine peptidase [Planctomycetes bacterium]|nr:prolyl oligopeptidase family serine peptidase [Planctomycetota bacterium]MCH9727048.1 prolyl oligopeptidase family serine peptidase [Planctomycetota bacterium]MCH9774991.1 prolyl oligopeptidase family serine peptidase [Planctomycetota bacterium]MCH9789234.1 prolyl oligopeptidase family serine peptidase [Planctomycetota bacterium]
MITRFVIAILSIFIISAATAAEPVISKGNKSLPLPGESFKLDGHDAFLILPPDVDANIPWIWYAPTLGGLPAKSEVWMFNQFLAKGIAIAGIDVGESFGSPEGRASYTAFYDYLVKKRRFREKPCLMARSRGGLMLYSWAAEHPQSVSGVVGIYPVCNIKSYPGIARAAGAYGLNAKQLEAELPKHNPIDRLKPLAKAGVPIFHIHGDNDKVVPLETNSAELARRYKAFGGPVEIEVVKGQGHNMWDGWFHSQRLTDFAAARALGLPLKKLKAAVDLPKPIAHWKLDDEGEVAKDSAGPHNGKIVGASLTMGRVGKALEFTRAQGDHVAIPYAKDLALSTFTVSTWVYLTRPPTFSGILGTRHGGDQTFDMKVNAAKVHGDIGDGKNWIETKVNFYTDDTGTNGEGGKLALNRWYHIVYVIDNTTKECRLYLDADLKKRIAFKGNPTLMTPENTMHIGHSSGTEFMDGRIDELKIWNQALTAQQVKSDWSATSDSVN